MYSFQTTVAATRVVRCERFKCSMNCSSNSSENPSINRSGLSPNTCICRWWPSDKQWHLNPFSSRHCFWHIWQYHLSFCNPLALILLAIAFGVRNSFFPMFANPRPQTRTLTLPTSCAPANDRAEPRHNQATEDQIQATMATRKLGWSFGWSIATREAILWRSSFRLTDLRRTFVDPFSSCHRHFEASSREYFPFYIAFASFTFFLWMEMVSQGFGDGFCIQIIRTIYMYVLWMYNKLQSQAFL